MLPAVVLGIVQRPVGPLFDVDDLSVKITAVKVKVALNNFVVFGAKSQIAELGHGMVTKEVFALPSDREVCSAVDKASDDTASLSEGGQSDTSVRPGVEWVSGCTAVAFGEIGISTVALCNAKRGRGVEMKKRVNDCYSDSE